MRFLPFRSLRSRETGDMVQNKKSKPPQVREVCGSVSGGRCLRLVGEASLPQRGPFGAEVKDRERVVQVPFGGALE